MFNLENNISSKFTENKYKMYYMFLQELIIKILMAL